MQDRPIIIDEAPGSADNLVLPFRIEGTNVRGRAVRLGTLAERILSAHEYAEPVAELAGEALALTALLGSLLKFEGTFGLQARGDGPVSMLVADFASPGALRGYAQHKSEGGATPEGAGVAALLGRGNLIMTIDPDDADLERYQGIVDLGGDTLSDCARGYFRSSEQIPTEVRLAARRDPVSGNWRAGGIMIQHLSRGETGAARLDVEDDAEEAAEAWRRAGLILETLTAEELTAPALDLASLLYRLYHEDGVRVFEATPLSHGCRCSEQKIEGVLARFSEGDRAAMVVDGKITVTCEFCNRDFVFES